MDDMTVVFFYMLDAPYSVHTARWRCGEGSLKAVCVILPLKLPGKTAEWTGKLLQRLLDAAQIPPEGRYVYYVPDKRTAQILGRGREPLGPEWILFLIEYYSLSFDSLVLVQNRELAAEELICHFAKDVPYLTVVALGEKGNGPDWEELEEELAVEYGLTLDVQESTENLCLRGKRPLFIWGTEEAEKNQTEKEKEKEKEKGPRSAGDNLLRRCSLPAGSAVICTDGRRQKDVAEFFWKKKVRYVDMEGFLRDTVLDTVHKIRYNSTR